MSKARQTGTKPIDKFLAKLKNVKKVKGGWTAQCPCHDDDRNSLCISEGADGRVLIYCHAGCHYKNVVQALGFDVSEMFAEDTQLKNKHYIPKTWNRQMTIKTYDYTDEKGNLLYQVCRTGKKEFPIRRPDGEGGWSWGLGDTSPVLYQLPLVVQAVQKGETVFIVEGEKDVDRLVSQGLAATTSPMGAGKWKPTYNAQLQGANVIIFPDNDEPGKEHALNVATQLQGIAKSAKIIYLPGLQEKEDVSDWLDKYGTIEQLLQLIQKTQDTGINDVSINEHEAPDEFVGQVYAKQVYTLIDALAHHEKPRGIVSGILPARSLSIWYGSPGSLKSNLLIDMCLSVATGTDWLPDLPGKGNNIGYSVSQAPALLIDIDNGKDVIAERLAAFARARNTPAKAPIYWLTFPTPPLIASKGLLDLTAYAQHIGAGLIVIDNLLRVAGVRDENASEIDTAMTNLRKFAETTGAAVAVIHHRRKDTMGREGDSLRGHSSIEAAVDLVFLIKREDGTNEITVKCTKARRKPVETFGALWTYTLASDGETLQTARLWRAQVRDPKAEAEAKLCECILTALADGAMNQTEITRTVGGNKANVITALSALIRIHQVKSDKGSRNATIYRLV